MKTNNVKTMILSIIEEIQEEEFILFQGRYPVRQHKFVQNRNTSKFLIFFYFK